MRGNLEDTCLTSCGWDCGMKSGDHAGALRAYELMRDSGFSKAVTSSTFNKLIQSASKSEGLDSAFQVYTLLGYTMDNTIGLHCTEVC